jgi:hypothetical protein
MISKGMIRVNDELFIVKTILDEKYEPLGPDWNALSPSHKTFKKDGKVFFCEQIMDVEIIEENVENTIE